MQTLNFRKMHGLANDFVILDNIRQTVPLDQLDIPALANRHLGIGFDQLLLIESSEQADFACRIFNADGSEAEQCGNGIRCVARFILEEGLSTEKQLRLETKAGIFILEVDDFSRIKVNMGAPKFEPQDIPFLIEHGAHMYEVADTSPDQLTVLSMGNPHTILRVPSLKDYPVAEMGEKLATLPAFPEGTNSGFVEVISRDHIRLRTFERGSGETFACGSNACAAVVAGIKNGWLDSKVRVELRYGDLTIEWDGGENPVLMTGPAASVFKGELTLS